MADDHYTPTMRSYEPTWRDQLAQSLMGEHRSTEPYGQLVSRLVGSSGLGESHAAPLDVLPVAGAGLSIEEDLERERYGSAAFDAGVGFLPFSKLFGRFLKDTVRGFSPVAYSASREGNWHLAPRGVNKFNIVAPEGTKTGVAYVSPRGKDLHVNGIRSNAGPRSEGVGATRNLYRDLQAYYPYQKTLSGWRVSGARTGPAGLGSRNTKVPLNVDPPRQALLPGGGLIKWPVAAATPIAILGAAAYDPEEQNLPSYDEYFRDFSPAPSGYAEGGSPPVGEPAIVGENGNVQLTPVDHDPFDDTIAQRAAHTISALAQHAADWWHNQPSWGEQAQENLARDKATLASGGGLRELVSDPAMANLASGFGGAGTFAGEVGAANLARAGMDLPKLALRAAREMEARGWSADEIYRGTSKMLEGSPFAGVHKGADGKFRFEISDYDLSVRKGYGAGLEWGKGEAWNKNDPKIIHDEIVNAYPGAFDYLAHNVDIARGNPVEGVFMPEGAGREEEFFYGDKPVLPTMLVRAPTTRQARSVASHELQHAIQTQEGFATGISPNLIRDAYKRVGIPHDQLTHDRLYDLYRRTAGETEARNVQSRLDLTPAERRTIPPWATEDVAPGRQIVLHPVDHDPFN